MSIRKRGNRYQVTYRVSGEATPRTETFKSEDEALIRDAQIRLTISCGKYTGRLLIERKDAFTVHFTKKLQLLPAFCKSKIVTHIPLTVPINLSEKQFLKFQLRDRQQSVNTPDPFNSSHVLRDKDLKEIISKQPEELPGHGIDL